MKKIVRFLIGLLGAVLILTGAFLNRLQSQITIIGGSDGPTSIFLAGKIGGKNFISSVCMFGGIFLLIVLIVMIIKKKKK